MKMNWTDIAIVGIDVKLPFADNVWQLAEALSNTQVSIRQLNQGAHSILENAEHFDAELFGYSEREASLLDPQHRVLLELCYKLLQVTNLTTTCKNIATFASVSPNIRHWNALEGSTAIQSFQNLLSNDKDFVATRIAHKLNLTGPALTIQSGCSSSLAAVHQAIRSLQMFDCDAALVSAASIVLPQDEGYELSDEMIYSNSGACRPYTHEADGTVGGSGAAVIALKRYEDAVKDNDDIWAVISGSAINNDGSSKMNFTAPSLDPHIEVIKNALACSDITPNQVSYVEGHGTGTLIGDSIELEALNSVYTHNTWLGSIKANIGHLDVASGLVGLIKTALTIRFQQIYPQLSAQETMSSKLKLPSSLHLDEAINYAAVSSLGIGGTNVHVVLKRHMICNAAKSAVTNCDLNVRIAANDAITLREYVEAILLQSQFVIDNQFTLFINSITHLASKYSTSISFNCKNLGDFRDTLCSWLKGESVLESVIRSDKGETKHRMQIIMPKLDSVLCPSPLSEIVKQDSILPSQTKSAQNLMNHASRTIISSIWSNILGNNVSVTDQSHFFDMGGDSLSAIDCIQQINKQLGTNLSSIDLYNYPRLSQLLTHIDSRCDLTTLETSEEILYEEL